MPFSTSFKAFGAVAGEKEKNLTEKKNVFREEDVNGLASK